LAAQQSLGAAIKVKPQQISKGAESRQEPARLPRELLSVYLGSYRRSLLELLNQNGSRRIIHARISVVFIFDVVPANHGAGAEKGPRAFT
jgi:hypothetical protein